MRQRLHKIQLNILDWHQRWEDIYQGGGGGDEPAPQPEEGEERLERLERDHP